MGEAETVDEDEEQAKHKHTLEVATPILARDWGNEGRAKPNMLRSRRLGMALPSTS